MLGVYRQADGVTYGTYLFNPITSTEATVLDLTVRSPWDLSLNNPTATHDVQVAARLQNGSVIRWTRGGGTQVLLTPLDSYSAPAVNGINDAGTLCGYTYVALSKGRRQQQAMRFADTLQLLPYGYLNANAINSSGDVTLGTAVYQDEWGALRVDQLIDTTDPDAAEWFGADVSSRVVLDLTDRRPETGFPALFGAVQFTGQPGRHCVLTPVPVGP